MFLIKKLVGTLAMPLPLTLMLLLVAGMLALLGRRRAARGLGIGALLLLLLASWGPVADGLLGTLEGRYEPVLDARSVPAVSHVVVLGSGYRANPDLPITSQLGDSAVIRLVEGVRLWRQVPHARLVLTGGNVFERESVARGYSRLAVALGVDALSMDVLEMPIDTAEEAYAVRDLAGREARILLVTSASHMDRARRHFERAGLDVIPAPTRHKSLGEDRSRFDYWVPSASHLRKTERALYEYLGRVSLWLDHRA
ncbi:MAG: YdcF family protein [Gammaproteobacteria bacterium]|nr:YdcF family protein [Gammaproteobacteria bacterium]